MPKSISSERMPTAQDKKIIKSLADGLNATEISSNKSLKLNMNERQVYLEIQKLKTAYNCVSIPNLVAKFLRSKIIE